MGEVEELRAEAERLRKDAALGAAVRKAVGDDRDCIDDEVIWGSLVCDPEGERYHSEVVGFRVLAAIGEVLDAEQAGDNEPLSQR